MQSLGKITCTSTNCTNNLHCFLQKKRDAHGHIHGACRDCGAQLVDWDRVHSRQLSDIEYTIESLQLELIRHSNWHKDIDQRALDHARKEGRIRLRELTRANILHKVGSEQPVFDGRQTPLEGKIFYYAQHATACCCRKCIEEWHGIERGVALSEEQVDYLTELSMRYIDERIPDLTEDGEKPIKHTLKELRKLASLLEGRH